MKNPDQVTISFDEGVMDKRSGAVTFTCRHCKGVLTFSNEHAIGNAARQLLDHLAAHRGAK